MQCCGRCEFGLLCAPHLPSWPHNNIFRDTENDPQTFRAGERDRHIFQSSQNRYGGKPLIKYGWQGIGCLPKEVSGSACYW